MPSSATCDVVIIGDGVVGLCCARALATRGAHVHLIGERQPGVASLASAGLLAPSLERAPGAVGEFMLACRDNYPSFAGELAEATGLPLPRTSSGILRVALDEAEANALRGEVSGNSPWLTPREIRSLEPSLRPTLGGLLHPDDGGVDPRALVAALDASLTGRIERTPALVRRVELSDREVRCVLATGANVLCRHIIVAAGAWAGRLPGLTRRLPVTPLRGQMASYRGASVGRAVFGANGYLVSRPGDEFWVGTTAENAGFVSRTTDEGLARLHNVVRRLLGTAPVRLGAWSGLRPMSPDGLPIVGPDPADPRVLYACGHSRNGILLAPGTAGLLSDFLSGRASPVLSELSVARFAAANIEMRSENPVTGLMPE